MKDMKFYDRRRLKLRPACASFSILFFCMIADVCASEPILIDRHVKVYFEQGRFGGWPANYGIWSWGNEILVGFELGYHKDQGPKRHAIDREKPRVTRFARSLDGGETWQIEEPQLRPVTSVPESQQPPLDFTNPDFALRVPKDGRREDHSEIHYSFDRGRNWIGPLKLKIPGIQARTDYLINDDHDCMLFLTAEKRNGKEGRPLLARSADGGQSWRFMSWIAPEPEGFSIMPTAVRLSESKILAVVRRREGARRWLNAHLSSDNGRTWQQIEDPVDDLGEGNPPSLITLHDGRLCLTYGYRAAPFRIAARISDDHGETWSDEIVLRDDGANRDQGYARTVQRPDGKIVTAYYFNDAKSGPERYIAATIWNLSPME